MIKEIREYESAILEYLNQGDSNLAASVLEDSFRIISRITRNLRTHSPSPLRDSPALSPETMEELLSRLSQTYRSIYEGRPSSINHLSCSSNNGGRAA